MSVANKEMQGNFGFPVAYIGGIVLSLGVYTLGVMLRESIRHGLLFCLICLGLLIVLTVCSGIFNQVINNRLNSKKVSERNAGADARLARMTQNQKGEWAKLRRLCILGYGYVVLLWLLCLGTIFFYGASGLSTEWIMLELIPMFFLTGLIGKLFRPRNKNDQPDALPEDKFPRLYALVRQAAGDKLKGRKLTIRVLDGIPDQECNAALSLKGNSICIWIGAVLLCVLDEAELKQVIYHEFAHIDKDDISEHRLYGRIMAYITADPRSFFGNLAEFALGFITNILEREGQFYFLLSSRQKENKADDRAASQGDREKQASALAKINAHTLFVYEREPYENIFVSEEIPQHLLTDRARAFREALEQRSDFWRTILEGEIPSRVNTHPTFRQRWEALGCCDYDLTPAETETEFARECWAAAETIDADRAAIPKEQYDAMRKESYLDNMAIIAEYESREWELSPEELRPPMEAYSTVGMPEKTEAICDKILREHDSPFSTAYASYWKGLLLLRRYDKAGLNYIYRAMDANTNYIENGLREIGRFCTMMGMQQELEEYRTRHPELMQMKMDRTTGGITSKAKLEKAELPVGWLDKILEYILSAAGEDLEAVYLVRELVSEEYNPSSFVLRFRENTAPERMDDIYERVFRLLDDWPEDYEFCLYYYEDAMEKPLSKVEGSCIWRKA